MSGAFPIRPSAVLSADPGLGEVIPFLLFGLLVVLLALSFLALSCGVVARVCGLLVRPAPAPTPASPGPVAAPAGLSPETVAVIAAAASTVIDGEHRILHIRRLTSGDWNWSMEGRMKHHASHQVR